MIEIQEIGYYYNQGLEYLKKNETEKAKASFLTSWERFNNSESTRIPEQFVQMAHKSIEAFRNLSDNDLDENSFDKIIYGH